MKSKIMFWHTKNTTELMDKKVKDGLINFKKRIWYIDKAKPKFFNANIIKPGDLYIFVTIFAFATGFLTIFGITYFIVGVMMAFFVSFILSIMKRPVPLYILEHNYSIPLERNDCEVTETDNDYVELKNWGEEVLGEPKNKEEFDKLSDNEKESRKLKTVIFKQMLAPAGLWALINRDTMKKALKSKSPIIDMIFYMSIGGAIGFMASIIIFGVNLGVLPGGI